MDLTTLAKQLQIQAQHNGTIVLDATILSDTQISDLAVAFLLSSGQYLTIEGVKAPDIPNPSPNSLTINAGTLTVFSQTSLSVQLIFTTNATDLDILIVVDLPTGWLFKNSFPKLDIFPFNQFSLQDGCFIFSSVAQSNYAPWSAKPTETINLSAGLNFAGWLTLDNFSSVLALLANIIVSGASYKFFGAFMPSNNNYPITSLGAELSDKTFLIGYAPMDVTLSSPALLVQIGDVTDGTQDIGFALQATLSLGLQFQIGISASGDTLSIYGAPPAGENFTAAQILQLPGGKDFQSVIPSEINNLFAAVGLKYYTMTMLTSSKSIGFMELAIGTVSPWKIIPNKVELNALVLQLTLIAPSSSASVTAVSVAANATVLPSIFSGDFAFNISLQKLGNSGWEVTRIQGEYDGIVKLGDLVQGTLGSSVTVPEELNDISFYNFGLIVDKTNQSYVCYGGIEVDFPILDTQINSALLINVTYSSAGYEVLLNGVLTIGEQSFDLLLDFSKESGQTDLILSASWTASGTDYLQFEDIVTAFGFTLPDIPSDLDLSLKSASFYYDYKDGTLVFSAESVNYGKAVLIVSKNSENKYDFYFLLNIDKTFSLSDLPLIGSDLAKVGPISFGPFALCITSASSVSPSTAQSINAIISALGSSYPTLPLNGLSGSFCFSAMATFGTQQLPLEIGMNNTGGSKQAINGSGSSATVPAVPSSPQSGSSIKSSTASDGTTWFTIQKNFGPVSIQKIGARYVSSSQTLWFEIDASLAMGPLTVSLDGLGIGSSIKSFDPQFSLQGLGLDWSQPPLSIAGAFINMNPQTGVEFAGGVTVGTIDFQLQALGFYGNQTGASSMFIFGDIAHDFGGPPAFFVTGVALGFGYNSNITLPTVDNVANFPFIETLPNSITYSSDTFPDKTPMAVLQNIMGSTPPWVTQEQGSLWFAAGITFSSFEMVNSQALVIVETGPELVISLLGVSRAQFPQPDGITSLPCYANIELDLALTFKPEDGEFSLQAVLSKSSFLLDPACVLTGGVAFCIWYGDNPYAGDFVLTLGGYNPGYMAPSYYPVVPKLGFNWSLDSSITVSGSAYIAFTPSVMMAGGELSAVYQSGNLKAWFDAHADIIIYWKPFWFDAEFGISVGASYRIDLLFTSCTVSVELGCNLEFWGPPTGGRVGVDWYIISFSIPFGSSKSGGGQTLGWSDVQTMLPNTGTVSDYNIISVTPNSGLLPNPSNAVSGWLVRKGNFGFSVSASAPATSLTVGKAYNGNGSSFNVAPMNWQTVSSTHSITITDSAGNDMSTHFTISDIVKNIPASIWGLPSDSSTPSGSDQLVIDQLVGVDLLVNPPQTGFSSGSVNITNLAGDNLKLTNALLPVNATVQPTGSIPASSSSTISSITDPATGIAAQSTITARGVLFSAIQSAGFAHAAGNDDMSAFRSQIATSLNAQPLIV